MYLLIYKLKNRKRRKNVKTDKELSKKIPIGFYLGVTNILAFMAVIFYITKIL